VKQTVAQQKKIHEVMSAFKKGKLNTGSAKGPKVMDRKQAIAIALAQAGAGQAAAGDGAPPWLVKGFQRRDVWPAGQR
jgi:hypothetical protein